MVLESQQKLVLSIIEFLNQSIQDGTVPSDDKEGLEVAVQCIGEAFGVNPGDKSQYERLTVKPATLQNIFDVYLKTRAKITATPSAQSKKPAAEDKAKAEGLKQEGNKHMSGKNYDKAIDSYTKAIALDDSNAIYYSNRAAAYTSKGDHVSAVGDAEKAIEIDPTFVKAYSRLGHSHFSMGGYTSAVSAFQRGLALDPNNEHMKSGLQRAKAQADALPERTPPSAEPTSAEPDVGAMADMLRNMGGGGAGPGGMPDLASMMNNPAMVQMAQQMMQNGGLDRLMSNPGVANMVNRARSGGGMPSMEEMMSDPTLQDLAGQFGMGGR